MSTSKEQLVLVLTDADGALYTITPEILRLGIVGDPKHEGDIRTYLKGAAGPKELSGAFPQLQVVGSYKRSLDTRIRRDYLKPQLRLLSPETEANP